MQVKKKKNGFLYLLKSFIYIANESYPILTAKLPKWFGERPGKKKDDPESPEGEEDVKAAADDDLEEPMLDEDGT